MVTKCEQEIATKEIGGGNHSATTFVSRFLVHNVNNSYGTLDVMLWQESTVDGAGLLLNIEGGLYGAVRGNEVKTSSHKNSGPMCINESLLQDLISEVTSTVLNFHGDVISFDGQYLLALFHDPINSSSQDQIAAYYCGIELSKLNSHIRVALVNGTLNLSTEYSKKDSSWECFVSGNLFSEGLRTLRDCPQVLVMSNKFQTDLLVEMDAIFDVNDSNTTDFEAACAILRDRSPKIMNDSKFANEASAEVVEMLNLFIPPAVLAAICTNSLDNLMENRVVTVLKVFLATSQHVSLTYQCFRDAIVSSGGYMVQFIERENGWLLEIAWGLPLSSYVNNSARSLYCALRISEKAHQVNMVCKLAITTSSALCGPFGCKAKRMYYLIVGSAVQQAEVLMNRSDGSCMLMSEASYNQLSRQVQAKQKSNVVEDCNHEVAVALPVAEWFVVKEDVLHDMGDFADDFLANSTAWHKLASQLDRVGNTMSTAHLTTRSHSASMMHTMGPQGSDSADHKSVSDDLERENCSAVFVAVVGNSGTGKSLLLNHVVKAAQLTLLHNVVVKCQQEDETIPFSTVSKILAQILGVQNVDTVSKQRKIIKIVLAKLSSTDSCAGDAVMVEEMLQQQYLSSSNKNINIALSKELQALFRFDWNEKAMSDVGDADVANALNVDARLFGDVLVTMIKYKKLLILLDDAQYCDELSWNQLHQLQLNCTSHVGIFIFSRPRVLAKEANENHWSSHDNNNNATEKLFSVKGGSASAPLAKDSSDLSCASNASDHIGDIDEMRPANSSMNYSLVLGHDNCQIIQMESLTVADVSAMLTKLLDKDNLAISPAELDSLVTSVYSFTAGNAYWCSTIAHFIKHHGVQAYYSAICPSNASERNLSGLPSLESHIACRLDLLSPQARLTIKYASVIGEQFKLQLLHCILPVDELPPAAAAGAIGSQSLWDMLEQLRTANFITLLNEDTNTYSFQNPLIRSTVYDMMSADMIADIHATVASQLVVQRCKDFALISSHFWRGRIRSSALSYIVKAAKVSIRHGAYAEAHDCLQQGLTWAVTRPELQQLLTLANQAAIKLAAPPPVTGISGLLRRGIAGVNDTARGPAGNVLFMKYNQLFEDISKTLDYMSQSHISGSGHSGSTRLEDDGRHQLTVDEEDEEDLTDNVKANPSCTDSVTKAPVSCTCVVS